MVFFPRTCSKIFPLIFTLSKYILRFSINETSGSKNIFHKIAIIEFQYIPMKLKGEEKDINPIGFQVTGYRVDDDSS